MKTKQAKTPTGEDFIETLRDHHSIARKCRICKSETARTAIVDLVYTFEVCSCELAPYDHLVETLYHRKCFEAATRG